MKKLINLSLLLFTIQLSLIAISAQTEQKAELVVQTGHSDTIKSVVFSPNGKLLVSNSNDKTIKFWDTESGKLLKTLPLPIRGGTISFGLEGKILVLSKENENIIKLWDIKSNTLIKTIPVTDSLTTLSPNGKLIALATLYSCQKTIKIWDVENNKLLSTFSYLEGKCQEGYESTSFLNNSIIFSPNGKILLTNESGNKSIRLWDIESGKLLNTLSENSNVSSVTFSLDGKFIASSGLGNGTIKIWDVKSGKLLKNILSEGTILSLVFSPDGKSIASGGNQYIISIWDVESENLLKTLSGHFSLIETMAFDYEGKTLASAGYDKIIKLWNIATGKEIKKISGYFYPIDFIDSSPDGKSLVSARTNDSGIIKIWDIKNGKLLKTLKSNNSPIRNIVFSPNNNLIVFNNKHKKDITILETENGKELGNISNSEDVSFITFSPDGKSLISIDGSGKAIKLWNFESRELIQTISTYTSFFKVIFSPDGKMFTPVRGLADRIKVYDAENGKLLQSLMFEDRIIDSAAFSPDGKILATSRSGHTKEIRLWNLEDGKELKTLSLSKTSLSNRYHSVDSSLSFSLDGKLLAFGAGPYTIHIFDIESGKELKILPRDTIETKMEIAKSFPKLYEEYYNAVVSDKYYAEVYENDKIKLFEKGTYKELATLLALSENDWAVMTPEGLYDSSPNARKMMHYVLELEPITLEQMKDLYYVPGLLQKIFIGEPLPKVELFSKKDLFPDVEFSQPVAGQKDLKIKLTNRGGGIGQVQVLVNGKEFVKDARPVGFDVNAKQTVTLNVSLKDAPFIAGGENKIEVVARNLSGSLTNRGTPRGTQVFNLGGNVQKETPNIYAIVGGISNYTGDNLKLNFAAKDAEDFAKAIGVGAVKLLGDKAKVHIRLLTSNGANSLAKFDVPDAKISTATKKDFENAFADFKDATPNDVFIVYLAGHGVSLNLNQNPTQAGGDTYLYLTQEATTTDKSVLSIENSRKAMAISSEELKDLMKTNKALKQVLILDTCAAGALSNSLVAKRDLPSDQIRAIERLKDNTGFYVLMGSSADAVSYEASQYGQGLLTYSLLQGMKGAKLRENQFADVNLLFSYAQETVPNMAKNIGGIQRPLIIMPDTSASFDIGKFTSDEQQRINLSSPKPIFLRPQLRNSALRFDNLKLSQMMSAELRQMSYAKSRDAQSPIVFVEADEMTDAILISGDYTIEGDTLKISVILVKNNQPIGKEIVVTGKSDESEKVIKQIVETVFQSLQ